MTLEGSVKIHDGATRAFQRMYGGIRQVNSGAEQLGQAFGGARAAVDGIARPIEGVSTAARKVVNDLGDWVDANGRLHNSQGQYKKMVEDTIGVTEKLPGILSRSVKFLNQMSQSAKSASQAIGSFRDKLSRATGNSNALLGTIKKVALAAGGIRIAQNAIGLSDELAQTTARLNMMNDGMQSTADLQKMIFAAAQRSRGEYQATADAVAKMGIMAKDAFSSNGELVAFMEQINKQFAIAGTSSEGMRAAMLQLTQAMGSGVLRGEELNSIFEQAPVIIQTIASYLDVPIGKIRALAQEGELSASVVKNAMLWAADETNAKFAEMPMTFAQIWTSIKNYALMAFQPILTKLSEIANSQEFQTFV